MENLYNSNIEKLKNENEEEKKKLEEQLSKNLDIGKIKNEKDQIIKNLKEKISNFDSQLKSKDDIINKLKSENDAAKKMYTKELDELRSINKSMSNKQNEITNLKKKIKSEKDSMESKYREEIDRINFQHTLEINEIQIKLDSQISKLKIENLQLKENYEKLLKSKNNIIINENNITEINGPIKINYENLNDNLTHQRNNFNSTQNIPSLNFLSNEPKSNFINYQSSNSNDKSRNPTNISSPINGIGLVKKNSKKLVPVKNINSIRLSKITINANLKK
jgi:chromosome segregation ATPase